MNEPLRHPQHENDDPRPNLILYQQEVKDRTERDGHATPNPAVQDPDPRPAGIFWDGEDWTTTRRSGFTWEELDWMVRHDWDNLVDDTYEDMRFDRAIDREPEIE